MIKIGDIVTLDGRQKQYFNVIFPSNVVLRVKGFIDDPSLRWNRRTDIVCCELTKNTHLRGTSSYSYEKRNNHIKSSQIFNRGTRVYLPIDNIVYIDTQEFDISFLI